MMRAAWYDRQGPAAEVLRVGDLPAPEPGPGDVRVRLRFSGINPGDTKKRIDRFGLGMPFPRVVPHSDGSGVIESVGEGVDAGRVGRRVWVYGAQSYRPFGTAAQLTVVPAEQAVELPEEVSDELGACLGIPGITAHRAVFADGPVTGRTVLVHGVLGAVGSLAAQLARWGGAEVITTVRRSGDYGTRGDRPEIPFRPLLWASVTIRLLGSDDFPAAATREAARALTTAAREGALSIPTGAPLPLERIAEAHDRVDAGARERGLISLP